MNDFNRRFVIYLLFVCIGGCFLQVKGQVKDSVPMQELRNPILPGYFADPSVVQYDGKFYLYATADPWGTDFLSCWVSDDFCNWTFHTLNWPTKQACSTSLSNTNKVWAPSVVRRGDTFYMYVSVGSEVWCGRALHPLGPWENLLGERPLIAADTTKYYHAIDAEAFIDDDGKVYLYWGSGWEWKNGHCFAAELGEDMYSFRRKPIEVTPAHYFEGPLMKKREGKYYLTYSEGKTIDETYEMRYAVGNNPFGPFTEAENSPVLKVCDSLQVYGPGHHTLFSYGGEDYILYHRHRLPFVKGTAYRQTCIARLTFDDARGEIHTLIPRHTQMFPDLCKNPIHANYPEKVEASSKSSDFTKSENMLDNDYTTRWEPADDDKNPVLTLFSGKTEFSGVMQIRFEYPWERYFLKVETSVDGKTWEVLVDNMFKGVSGSPVDILLKRKCRQMRLSFARPLKSIKPSIWELCFYLDKNDLKN